jgi:hypothetical protein
MTEHDWLNSTDPQAMLGFLRDSSKLSERKARLFACACVRRVWHLLRDHRSQRAVEAAEDHIDGRITAKQLVAARSRAAVFAWQKSGGSRRAAVAAVSSTYRRIRDTVGAAFFVRRAVAFHPVRADNEAEGSVQATLLRDIFGPQPSRSLSLDTSLLRWQNGTIGRLAQTIYEERELPSGTLDNIRLALLADALEDAGLDNPVILTHLRQERGVHVRGCWVLDLVLGKA